MLALSSPSEQPGDVAVGVDIDVLTTRMGGEAGYHPHVADHGGNEAGVGVEADLADRDAEAGGPSEQRRVVAEAVLAD